MKSPLGRKFQKLAIGALAAAALSIPALSTVSVSAHADHWLRHHHDHSFSSRLAEGVTPHSMRLT